MDGRLIEPWYYQGKVFEPDEDFLKSYVGFVYCLTEIDTGMKYLGKKFFWSTRKLPPLKGKSRKRTKIVESDWKEYHGSSNEVKELVEQGLVFKREILRLCKTKGELTYYELKEQVDRSVLFKPEEYYNAFIGCKIHRSHVLKE